MSAACLPATAPLPLSVDRLPCWCQQGKWQVQFRTKRFGVLRCSACGCFRTDPPPLSSDHESESFYTDYYDRVIEPRSGSDSGQQAGSCHRYWKVARQVPGLQQAGTSIVDIGCGEGDLCAQLRSAGWSDVVGVDISHSRIRRARGLFPEIRFYDQPLSQTDCADQTFDVVVLDNVIEHIPSPVSLLQGLLPNLGRDGRLVMITPNMDSGCFRLLGRRWTNELCPHAHVFLYTLPSISRLLQQAGYQVEQTGTVQTAWYPVGNYLQRALRGDVKGAAWRMMQELGCTWSRIIDAGPMLYAVARPQQFAG